MSANCSKVRCRTVSRNIIFDTFPRCSIIRGTRRARVRSPVLRRIWSLPEILGTPIIWSTRCCLTFSWVKALKTSSSITTGKSANCTKVRCWILSSDTTNLGTSTNFSSLCDTRTSRIYSLALCTGGFTLSKLRAPGTATTVIWYPQRVNARVSACRAGLCTRTDSCPRHSDT